VHRVVIEFSWAGECRCRRIQEEWIIGYQGRSVGLGWREIARYSIVVLIFHDFPIALRAQQSSLPLLSGSTRTRFSLSIVGGPKRATSWRKSFSFLDSVLVSF